MIKRIILMALALFSICTASFVKADSGIVVLDSDVELRFPVALVFNIEAESEADIVDARLKYYVDKMNYARVISEGWPDFTPASKIKTSWTWDMRKSSLPSGATVTYWWTIRDAIGNEIETLPAVIHFDDDRYQWQSLTSSKFPDESQALEGENSELTLFWYKGDDSFASELMDACQQGLDRLTRDLGTYPQKPIKIYVYASAMDLQKAMIFPQEWTGGVAFTEFSIIAIGISPDNIDWGKESLVHELTHLVVHQTTFSPYGRLPTWLDEGLAMYNQGELSSYFRTRLNSAISEGELISVRSLCSLFSAETDKACLSYAESYSLVEYLLHHYGQQKMLDLLTVLKYGNTYDEALTEIYGFDVDGLDLRWRETLVTPAVPAETVWLHPGAIAVSSINPVTSFNRHLNR